ncbi:MAG: serine/threonine protein kinase [Planctomycetes bacterium]|nr:serine/threonine protein kinase [Planctomycetota bacterium]
MNSAPGGVIALATINNFADAVLQSQLLDAQQCADVQRLQTSIPGMRELAQELLRRDWLTAYQVNQIAQGNGSALKLGPFVLLERIGEGGMGQVFKARQTMLQRVVALKVIRKECLHNPKVIKRFQREIRAAGQLSHPHIVRAYDADQINGAYYIAMEYIDGVDLNRLVKENGPLAVDQACEYIRQAALGLQHAFERGMVHRDIKPANLLVTRAVASDRRRSSGLIQRPLNLDARRSSSVLPRVDLAEHYPWGIVKILDMGLARCTDPLTGQAGTHLTQIGTVMGTPEYIAPEQARDSHTSDVRADLYSLGCTLYFLLTGQPPFPVGTLTEKLLQHQLDEPQAAGPVRRKRLLAWKGTQGPANVSKEMLELPTQVEQVLSRLLAKRPEDRHQTPAELANELQSIVTQLAAGTLPKLPPPARAQVPVVALVPDDEVMLADSTAVLVPIIQARPQPERSKRFAALIALALASLGGFVCIALVTVIAVMMTRGSRTQAGVIEPDPPAKKSSKK